MCTFLGLQSFESAALFPLSITFVPLKENNALAEIAQQKIQHSTMQTGGGSTSGKEGVAGWGDLKCGNKS